MNAPATFAWTKPIVSPARWRRLDCFGFDVRIKQSHGPFEMRQIGAMLIGLALKTFDHVRDFQSLVAQGRDNQCRGHGCSRGQIMTNKEHSGSRAAPVEGAGGSCYIRPHVPWLSSVPDAWGRCATRTPFRHHTGDSHRLRRRFRRGPLRHLRHFGHPNSRGGFTADDIISYCDID
jgi:hypothetical protein